MSVGWGHYAAKCDVLNFWHLRHLLASCRSLRAVTLVMAIRVPVLIKVLADVLDRKCKVRWVVDWLFTLFSGGLIYCAVETLPGCNEFADSTAARSSLDVGSNKVGTNSAITG